MLWYNLSTNSVYHLVECPGFIFSSDLEQPFTVVVVPRHGIDSAVEHNPFSQLEMVGVLTIVLAKLCSGRVTGEFYAAQSTAVSTQWSILFLE